MLKIFFSIKMEIEKSEIPHSNFNNGELEQKLKVREYIEKIKTQIAIKRDKYLTIIYKTTIFILIATKIILELSRCFFPIRSNNHFYYTNISHKHLL